MPVGEADEGRHDGAENHNQRMNGGERIEQFWLQQLNTRLHQLGANTHRQQPAGEEHNQREPQVQRADIFMVGGLDPPHQSARVVVVVIIVTTIVGVGCCHNSSP